MFKELSKNHPAIKFIHVDVDDAGETMPNELADVAAVPTFKAYKNGKLVHHFSGANLNKLKECVELLSTELDEPKKEAKKSVEKKTEEEEKPKSEEAKKIEEPKKEEAKTETESKKKNEEEKKSSEDGKSA